MPETLSVTENGCETITRFQKNAYMISITLLFVYFPDKKRTTYEITQEMFSISRFQNLYFALYPDILFQILRGPLKHGVHLH